MTKICGPPLTNEWLSEMDIKAEIVLWRHPIDTDNEQHVEIRLCTTKRGIFGLVKFNCCQIECLSSVVYYMFGFMNQGSSLKINS